MQLSRVTVDAAARLRLALVLTAIVLVVEVVGGLWAHSLALLSDAGHIVTDLVVLALSTFALRQVQRPASPRRRFRRDSRMKGCRLACSWRPPRIAKMTCLRPPKPAIRGPLQLVAPLRGVRHSSRPVLLSRASRNESPW